MSTGDAANDPTQRKEPRPTNLPQMSPGDVDAVNRACRVLHDIALVRGLDVIVYVKHDGRVCFQLENVLGFVIEAARADIHIGGAMPLPAQALDKLVQSRVTK